MADYTNASAGILEVGGKSYAPGAKMSLTAAQLKDPTVDWWKRSGFIVEGEGQPLGASQPQYIPTPEEVEKGETIRMTDDAPNAAKADRPKG